MNRLAARCAAIVLTGSLAVVLTAAPTSATVAPQPRAAGPWGVVGALPLPAGAGAKPLVQIAALSCPSAGNCVAVGLFSPNSSASVLASSPAVWTETAGVWARPKLIALPANSTKTPSGTFSSVSCAAVGECVAVGAYTAGSHGGTVPLLASASQGQWSAATQVNLSSLGAVDPAKLTTRSSLTAVSCPALGTCVAVGSVEVAPGTATRPPTEVGFADTLGAGTWTPSLLVASDSSVGAAPGSFATWTAISCPAVDACTALGVARLLAGYLPVAATETGGVWGAPVELPVPASAKPTGVSPLDGGTFAGLGGLSCDQVGSCVAVGNFRTATGGTAGTVLREVDGQWGPASVVTLPADAYPDSAIYPQSVSLNEVACADDGSCTAVGDYGSKLNYNQSHEALVLPVDPSGQPGTGTRAALPADAYAAAQYAALAGVSCAGGASCQAVGAYVTKSGSAARLVGFTLQPATTPEPPTAVVATAGDALVHLRWTAPASNGGAAITSYLATASPGGQTCTTATTSCTIAGLANDQPVTFTVTATNAVGSSVASAPSAPVTPQHQTLAPGAVVATAGDGQVTVRWAAALDQLDAPVTGYVATASPGGQSCSTTTALTCTIAPLHNGQRVAISVVATSTYGPSLPTSAGAVTPAGRPGTPVLLRARTITSGFALLLARPALNGSALRGYQSSVDGGQHWVTLPATSLTASEATVTVTGLARHHRYELQLRAVNGVGAGVPTVRLTLVTA